MHENVHLRKSRRDMKTRLSIDKLLFSTPEYFDLEDFQTTFSCFKKSHCLEETFAFKNMLNRSSHDISETILPFKSFPIHKTTLIKIGIVLPENNVLNASIRSWMKSRLNFCEVWSCSFSRVIAVLIDQIEDLYGCDCVLFIHPPSKTDDNWFDRDIRNYAKALTTKVLVFAPSNKHVPDKDESTLYINITQTTMKEIDNALKRCLICLIQDLSLRYLVKTNLASIMVDILNTYFMDCQVLNVHLLLKSMCSKLKEVFFRLPDKFQDFPAYDFVTEGYVENYFFQDTDGKDLSIDWRIQLEKSLSELEGIFEVDASTSNHLLSILERNCVSKSISYLSTCFAYRFLHDRS